MPYRSSVLFCGLLLVTPALVVAQESISTSKIYLGSVEMTSGSGSPEGVVAAPVGSTYYRTDTGVVYVKTSGASSTGWSSISAAPYTAGDLIYANSSSTLAKLAAVASGQVLASNGVGVPPLFTASPSLTSIGGAANLTLNPSLDLILGPGGNDVLPSSGYTKNLGALTNKFLTLHAAELWVETLVAQDTMATIGGRVVVGPTTTLTSDLSAGGTSIAVKHNQMAIGDVIVMQTRTPSGAQVEWMKVTSGPSGSGPYTYSVTRNLDLSGPNSWTAGDAVFNSGVAGDGYIDLYSINGLLPGSTAGPTIVGNVRVPPGPGDTVEYDNVQPRWAIGNLNGLYGYGSDTYGAAFGDNNNAWVKIDPANGVRIGEAGTTFFQVYPDGSAMFAGRLTIGLGRNWFSNSEFRGEGLGFGTSTWPIYPTNGPKSGYNGSSIVGGSNAFWIHGYYNGTGTPTWEWHCNQTNEFPLGGGACALFTPSTPSNGSGKQVYGPSLPVIAGRRYEFSGYVGQHNSNRVEFSLNFYDASNNPIAGVDVTAYGPNAAQSSAWTTYSDDSRGWTFATAPAGAVRVLPIVTIWHNTPQTALVKTYFTRMYFSEAGTSRSQDQLTPWSPGGTTLIDGSMLQTDLAVANKIHSTLATDLGVGVGFWLDATSSTPTFRVGNPGGNEIKWDGTNVTLRSANLTIDGSSIRIAPIDSGSGTFSIARGYVWNVANGVLGASASDGPGNGRFLDIRSEWRGPGNRPAWAGMGALSENNGAGQRSAGITFSATANGISVLTLSAQDIVFYQVPTSGVGSAGALAGYMKIRVGFNEYKVPLYNPNP